MDLDKILELVGGWGKFQMKTFMPLCLVGIFSAVHVSFIFVARDVKYRCRINSCSNDSDVYNPDWLRNAVPFEHEHPNRCLFYMSRSNDTCTDFTNITQTCHDYVFQKNQTTIVQDFDIACDENLWKLTLVGTINCIGALICLPIFGLLSDRFGRKVLLLVAMILCTAIGLIKSFSNSYGLYLLLEFLGTTVGAGLYGGAFILALEIVDGRRRSLANSAICVSFAVGEILLGLAAWATPTWRLLLQVIFAPGVLILCSLWYIPESIRWLVSKNKLEHARKIIRSMSKVNKLREVNLEMLSLFEYKQEKKVSSASLKDIVKSKALVARIIHSGLTWLCCFFPYYGLMIQAVALSEDVYINFIATAVMEIPACMTTGVLLERIGRRKTLGGTLIMGGIFCGVVFLLQGGKWLTLSFFLLSKFFITIAYNTLYVYTAEMFPTSCRNTIINFCAMFGNIGSMLAPQVPILERIFKSLPLIIFCIMATTSGILAFWFPETRNKKLPNEIDDAVNV